MACRELTFDQYLCFQVSRLCCTDPCLYKSVKFYIHVVSFIKSFMPTGNNIATYCCAVFLGGNLRDKIIHSTFGHSHLCSCRLWVARPPKYTETEVCRQFATAVILVPVGFGYNLLLHITDLVAFFSIPVFYIK